MKCIELLNRTMHLYWSQGGGDDYWSHPTHVPLIPCRMDVSASNSKSVIRSIIVFPALYSELISDWSEKKCILLCTVMLEWLKHVLLFHYAPLTFTLLQFFFYLISWWAVSKTHLLTLSPSAVVLTIDSSVLFPHLPVNRPLSVSFHTSSSSANELLLWLSAGGEAEELREVRAEWSISSESTLTLQQNLKCLDKKWATEGLQYKSMMDLLFWKEISTTKILGFSTHLSYIAENL